MDIIKEITGVLKNRLILSTLTVIVVVFIIHNVCWTNTVYVDKQGTYRERIYAPLTATICRYIDATNQRHII